MQILQTEHRNIRILASRQLSLKYGIEGRLRSLPRQRSGNAATRKTAYGVPLDQLKTIEVPVGNDVIPIPKVFEKLVCFIRAHINKPGIFREEGKTLKTLVRMLNYGYRIPEETHVIDACVVMKLFIRQIPGRLIPKEETPWFLQAGKLKDALNLCVLLLPLENLYLLVYLMQFFQEVTRYSSENKMTSHNLSVQIAPVIFPTSSDEEHGLQLLKVHITKVLIKQAHSLGVVPVQLTFDLEALREEENNKKTLWKWLEKLLAK